MTISALCIFSDDLSGDNANGAAEALRAAGYQVFRLTPELQAKIEIEGDDFIEVRRAGDADKDSIDAMWADVKRIVAPFDADIDCVGPAAKEPFNDLWPESERSGTPS
jgi:hypothetical protein